MPRPIQQATVNVDPRYNERERRIIGNAILDYIKKRTKTGQGPGKKGYVGKDGSNKYAPSYEKSKEFKAFSKSSRPINLTLTGKMLDSVKLLDTDTRGRITYGFKEQDFQNEKAAFNKEKGYKFLELTQKEVDSIAASVPIPEVSNADISPGLAQELLRRLGEF